MEVKKGFLGGLTAHVRGIQLFLVILAGLFALYSLLGFFALPPILKSVLLKQVEAKTGRQTEIRDISTNPYWLTAEIKGLTVKDRDGATFLSFDGLFADYQIVSAFKRGSVVREVRLSGPYLKVVRNPDLTYNLSALFSGKKKPQAGEKPAYYSVNNIQIYGGRVDFHDLPKDSLHTLSEITFTVPFVSNLDYYVETFVQPRFSAKLDGRAVSLKGRTKPFAASRQTEFDLDIKGLDLTKYTEYLPEDYRLNIKSGVFSAEGKLSFIETKTEGGGKMTPSLKLAGVFTLSDFRLDGQDGKKAVSVPSFKVALREAEVFSKQVSIDGIEVSRPELSILRDKAGKLNLAALLPPKKAAAPPPAPKPEEPGRLAVKVASVKLTEGKLHFADEKNTQPFKTTLAPVDFEADNIVYDQRQAVGTESRFRLSATSETDESVDMRGRVSLRPLKAAGALSVRDVPVKKYHPYLADSVNFSAPRGTLGVSSDFSYSGGGLLLSGLSVDLRSLALRKAGETGDFLAVPSLLITRTDVDIKNKRLTVGAVETKGGRVVVVRDGAGKLNLAGLTKPEGEPEERKGAGAKGSPWRLAVKDFGLSSYKVDFSDYSAESPVETAAEDVRLSVKGFSLSPEGRSTVSLSFRQGGSGVFKAGGSVTVVPFAADLTVDIRDIGVIPFQPYFTRKINMNVISGAVSANGRLRLSYSREKGFAYRYSGEAAVNEFASADKEEGEKFLDWKTLYIGGAEAASGPFSLNIKQVALSDFYSRLIIYPDGSLNVQGLVKKPEGRQAEERAAPAQPIPGGGTQAAQKDTEAGAVKIERVTLQGGQINFTDNFIKPNYTADLTEIGGRISGLSSDEQASADVDLRGRINDYAPIQITGRMNPLRRDLYVDLKLGMDDMDLSQLTPYARKYVGYSIAKGKLSMDLRYLIVKRALDARNRLFFDQLTLGQRSASPDAVRLPVKLAISLLKNRQGEINLDFPVTGNLADPKFRFGDVVLRVVMNTLRRIVSSPFALLGRLFGGGQELGYVEFDYGSDRLPPPGQEKVAALNKALFNRPELELEVAGYADPEKDKAALRSYKFTRKLKEARYEDMAKDERPAEIDQVQVKPEEYEKYLRKAYKAEKFPKPKNVLGLEKVLPVPEMEKLMLAHIQVTEEDLTQLARKRAAAVQDALLKPGNVDPKRVFMVTPGTVEPEEKKDMKESRVEFGLK